MSLNKGDISGTHRVPSKGVCQVGQANLYFPHSRPRKPRHGISPEATSNCNRYEWRLVRSLPARNSDILVQPFANSCLSPCRHDLTYPWCVAPIAGMACRICPRQMLNDTLWLGAADVKASHHELYFHAMRSDRPRAH